MSGFKMFQDIYTFFFICSNFSYFINFDAICKGCIQTLCSKLEIVLLHDNLAGGGGGGGAELSI
jgi:hypothetical protein